MGKNIQGSRIVDGSIQNSAFANTASASTSGILSSSDWSHFNTAYNATTSGTLATQSYVQGIASTSGVYTTSGSGIDITSNVISLDLSSYTTDGGNISLNAGGGNLTLNTGGGADISLHGNTSINYYRIKFLGEPESGSDATTRDYVDTSIASVASTSGTYTSIASTSGILINNTTRQIAADTSFLATKTYVSSAISSYASTGGTASATTSGFLSSSDWSHFNTAYNATTAGTLATQSYVQGVASTSGVYTAVASTSGILINSTTRQIAADTGFIATRTYVNSVASTSGGGTTYSSTSGSGITISGSNVTSDTSVLATKTYVSSAISSYNSTAGGTVLFSHYNDIGNVTSTETDFYSDTIEANTLGVDGKGLKIKYAGSWSGGSGKRIRVYFGGNVIGDTGSVAGTAPWFFDINIIRVSSSSIRCVSTISGTTTITDVGSLTLSGTNILKITGQHTSTSDLIFAKYGLIELW